MKTYRHQLVFILALSTFLIFISLVKLFTFFSPPIVDTNLFSTPDTLSTPQLITRQIDSNNLRRTYYYSLPTILSDNTSVIFAFHGGGDTGQNMDSYTNLSSFRDKYNYLIVYPQGFDGLWSQGRNQTTSAGKPINDIQFIRDILSDLKSKHQFNPKHLYAVGFSAGGYFTHFLACQNSIAFTSLAVVSANLPSKLTSNCHSSDASSIIAIIGGKDPSYFGGTTQDGLDIYSTTNTLKFWAKQHQCDTKLLNSKSLPTLFAPTDCNINSPVVGISLSTGGHDWYRSYSDSTLKNFDTTQAILDFFFLTK